MNDTSILTIESSDRKGLVAAVTDAIFRMQGNIVRLDQYTNNAEKKFFMRLEWEMKGTALARDVFTKKFAPLAKKLGLDWKLFYTADRPQVVVLVSKYDHCLFDLLLRVRSGELQMDIPCIISNHQDLEEVARMFSIPFHYVPAEKDLRAHEREVRKIIESAEADLIVLARYMRVLSPAFVGAYPERIINVHHSFLPAFSGAKPYHQAYARGVKVIGATSHFVTKDLDAGPIIEQETIKISHEDSVEDLIMKGRDLERKVLAQAVQHFIQHRLFVDGQRTIIL